MNKAVLNISILSLLLLFSCKKEEVIVDREDLLQKDTAVFLYRANYLSHTSTNLFFDLEMLVFNETEPEINYNEYDFFNIFYSSDIGVSFSNISTPVYSSIPQYSTAILLDLNENISYRARETGAYLRRFFELADSLPNRNVALLSFAPDQNSGTNMHIENSGQLFSNSWEYNVQTFHELIFYENAQSNPVSGAYLKSRIIDAIDAIVNSSQAQGDLSVTLVTGYGGYNFTAQSDADDIINYANLNNVHINIVGPRFDANVGRLAIETGGVICVEWDDENYQPVSYAKQFSALQMGLLNLDKMLRHDVRTHHCTVDVSQLTASTWQSGQIVWIPINYSGYRITTSFEIP